MSENPSDDLVHSLREAGAHYVVDTRGQPVAVLLTLDEYEHYLDLLDDEADSQDEELASRLEQVTAVPSQFSSALTPQSRRQRGMGCVTCLPISISPSTS